MKKNNTQRGTRGCAKMSEYPIGLNGEMIHCFDNSEYAEYFWSKLEQEIEDLEEKG